LRVFSVAPTPKKQKTDNQVDVPVNQMPVASVPTSTPILSLASVFPLEIFTVIFSYLPGGDLIYTIPLVSKFTLALTQDSAVYRMSIFRDFPWTKNLDQILRAKGTPINEQGKPSTSVPSAS
jgi:hypothetical protein